LGHWGAFLGNEKEGHKLGTFLGIGALGGISWK